MGQLGDRHWFRCRGCGLDFSIIHTIDDFLDLDPEGKDPDLDPGSYAPIDSNTPMPISPDEFCAGCSYMENLGHKGSDFLGLCRLGWPGVFSEETVTCGDFVEIEG